MISFKPYTQNDILTLTNIREGETRIGQTVATLALSTPLCAETINQSNAKYVLIGIPEDIGVRANYGIGGANTAWQPFLNAFLNLQENSFLTGEDILVLGHFEVDELLNANIAQLRSAVTAIDSAVINIVKHIFEADKTPIIIGGGHNNAYPILKAFYQAKAKPINIVNIDAHADCRPLTDGRHSGNSFSFALAERLMSQYYVFGLQQNYLTAAQHQFLNANKAIKALYLDDILKTNAFTSESFKTLLTGLKSPYGLEIDLDSITGLCASAITPSGFSLNEVRKCILALDRPFSYLHICEGAIQLANGVTDLNTAKAINYLVTDFIKTQNYSSSSS